MYAQQNLERGSQSVGLDNISYPNGVHGAWARFVETQAFAGIAKCGPSSGSGLKNLS